MGDHVLRLGSGERGGGWFPRVTVIGRTYMMPVKHAEDHGEFGFMGLEMGCSTA